MINKKETFNIKIEYVKYSLSLLLSAITILISCFFINKYYNPDISIPLKEANTILLNLYGGIPEPKEKMMFFTSIVFGVLSLFGYYIFLNNFFKKNPLVKIDNLYTFFLMSNTILFVFITYKCFSSANPFHSAPENSHDIISITNFDFYFIKTFLYNRLAIYALIVYPLILTLFLNSLKISKQLKDKFDNFSLTFAKVYCLFLSVSVIGFCAFKFPYTYENKFDFNAVFYSLVQVYNGFPLLIDGFTNTYGLYPHFLMPILKITGLSILSFSTIMGIMLCFCFRFIFYFLNKTLQNKWLVVFGFSSVFYTCYLYHKIIMNYDATFVMYPIRWFPLMFFLAYSVFYVTSNQTKPTSFYNKSLFFNFKPLTITPLKILGYFIFSFGILWSPDFGLFAFISLIAFFIYYGFNYDEIKNSIIYSILEIVLAVTALLISCSIYALIIKVLYGSFPDFNLIYSTVKVFSFVGYAMLPMPTYWHPWMLIATVYLVGWLISISNFINNKKSKESMAIFVLTVLGTISFSYYQGRSHNWSLFIPNFEAFLLLPFFAQELYNRSKNELAAKITFAMILFLTAFSPFQVMGSFESIKELYFTTKDRKAYQNEQNKITETSKIIDNLCQDKERIFILSSTSYQGLYHNLSKTASFVNPGFIDMFTKKQYENIVEKLKTDSPKIFFEPDLYNPNDTKILNVLGAYYNLQLLENAPYLYYYKKKEVDKKNILDTTKNVLFYNNFNVDFNKNLALYEGKTNKIIFPDVFSIEIIFMPTANIVSRLNKNSTLLSNIDGSKGFVIQQTEKNINQYVFADKFGGILCNVELNKWNYIAFEVNKQHLKCFVNGQLQSEININQPFENSDAPLFIGSFKDQGAFFFGNIKEIKISNAPIDGTQFTNNWSKIKIL